MSDKSPDVINNSGHKHDYNYYFFYKTEKKFHKITLINKWTNEPKEIKVEWPWKKIDVNHAIVDGKLSIDLLFKDVIL